MPLTWRPIGSKLSPITFRTDGLLPHWVQVDFPRPIALSSFAVYLCANDESFCPMHMVLQAGLDPYHMIDVCPLKVDQPEGWLEVRWEELLSEVRAIRLRIEANFNSGKDTRIRALRINI